LELAQYSLLAGDEMVQLIYKQHDSLLTSLAAAAETRI
jgi:hypothetical protein